MKLTTDKMRGQTKTTSIRESSVGLNWARLDASTCRNSGGCGGPATHRTGKMMLTRRIRRTREGAHRERLGGDAVDEVAKREHLCAEQAGQERVGVLVRTQVKPQHEQRGKR